MSKHDQAMDELFALQFGDAVPLDVRDAAKRCRYCISYGGTPPHDLMDVITAYIGKQQQQDKYGK